MSVFNVHTLPTLHVYEGYTVVDSTHYIPMPTEPYSNVHKLFNSILEEYNNPTKDRNKTCVIIDGNQYNIIFSNKKISQITSNNVIFRLKDGVLDGWSNVGKERSLYSHGSLIVEYINNYSLHYSDGFLNYIKDRNTFFNIKNNLLCGKYKQVCLNEEETGFIRPGILRLDGIKRRILPHDIKVQYLCGINTKIMRIQSNFVKKLLNKEYVTNYVLSFDDKGRRNGIQEVFYYDNEKIYKIAEENGVDLSEDDHYFQFTTLSQKLGEKTQFLYYYKINAWFIYGKEVSKKDYIEYIDRVLNKAVSRNLLGIVCYY